MADLKKAVHAFEYAPGLDAPYFTPDEWVKACAQLKTALETVRVLLTQARAAEALLWEPATAEEARDRYRALDQEALGKLQWAVHTLKE